MEILLIIMCFISTLFLIYYVLLSLLSGKIQILKRLDVISKNQQDKESELDKPVSERIFKPMFEFLGKNLIKITPNQIITALEKRIITAGIPFKFSAKHWLNLQAGIIVIVMGFSIIVYFILKIDFSTSFLIFSIGVAFTLLFPLLLLNQKANERKAKLLKDLPDVLDLLTVSVEAGLGFDGALSKVVEKMPGPLGKEFGNVLQEVKMGRQRKDALRGFCDRVNVPDLTAFVGAVIQAEQLGVSIGNILRIQSEQMRAKRRQRAQEKAMKAPIKMLIPMVIFIFPTIFSVLIGPIIIRVMENFK
jgi:tight adherence protein C